VASSAAASTSSSGDEDGRVRTFYMFMGID